MNDFLKWLEYLDLCEKSTDEEIEKIIIENKEKKLLKYISNPDKRMKCAANLFVTNILSENDFYNELKQTNNEELYFKYQKYLNDSYKLDILCSINRDDLKIKSLEDIDNDTKYILLSNIKNNTFKFNYLKLKIHDPYQRKIVLKSMTDDNILMNYYPNAMIDEKVVIAIALQNDSNKMKTFNDFNYHDKIKIIKSMNDENKIKFLNDKEYLNDYAEIALSIKDNKIKKDYFLNNDNEQFKIIFTDKLNNYFDIKDYVYYLNKKEHQNIVLSNILHEKMVQLAIYDYEDKDYSMDHNLSFNIELNLKNEDYKNLRKFTKILANWKIEDNNGKLKIISPELKFNNTYMRELSFMCDFLKKIGFYCDEECLTYIYTNCKRIKLNKSSLDFEELVNNIKYATSEKNKNTNETSTLNNKIKSLFKRKK